MFTHSARVFLFFFHDTSTTRIYTFPYTTLFRSVETRVAAPARVEVRVGDAIAFAQRAAEGIRLHLRAEPGHPAHHLVPVDPPILRVPERRVATPEMQIRAADVGDGHPNQDALGFHLRNRDVPHLERFPRTEEHGGSRSR